MKGKAQGHPQGPENVCQIVPDRYDSAKAGVRRYLMTCETLRHAPGQNEEEIHR
jgi:hypothetical protein